MIQCRKCNRSYSDETLNYCLEDGTRLVPHSNVEDTATAVFSDPEPSGEARTVILSRGGSEPPAVARGLMLPADSFDDGEKQGVSVSEYIDAQLQPPATAGGSDPSIRLISVRLIVGFLVLLIPAAGFFAYRYFTPNKQIESIAVMPFVNESGNADVEYLSDGMTETLITSLSRLPNLTVKPRSSVFRYKGKNTDVSTLAKELNVEAILTGTVVQRGTDIGLHVELVDTETERVLWSEDYKRPLSVLAVLQAEIARSVSTELKTKLSGTDVQQLVQNYTNNTEAYQLYLKGRFYLNKRTKDDLYKSIEYYRQAVDSDPNYAPAYAGLADAFRALPGYDFSTSPRDSAIRAREYALKALSLNDALSEAHISVGSILQDVDHDFGGAEREFKRAIELDSNNGSAYSVYALLLMALGRTDEAMTNIKRALELEPVSLPINRNYGNLLMLIRKYDESEDQMKKTIDLDQSFILGYLSLANTYQVQGKYPAAVETYAKSREVMGNTEGAALIRDSFAKNGWTGVLRTMTEDTRLSEMRPSYMKASAYVTLRENDKALAELEKAYEDRSSFILILNVDPRFGPLRGDPRFQELLRKVGFPQ